eukprot:GSMAST32.ASY1.ANO1.69.1 assembled CDS
MTSDGGFLWFEKINEYGENKLTPPKTKSEFIKFMEQMTGFFSLLLWGVFLTGVFGYCQERKSSNLMDSFKNMLPSTTIVIRDGQPKEINATMLVPGDIIKLKAGNKVPADVRVLSVSGTVEVDNASLTGEAEPNPLETRNLAFFVSTGDDTVMGQTVQTPINKQIHHFVTIVSSIAFILGISFFLFEMITNLVFMIGIIVANVPEGLLATVTVCMALTAHRMANNNVLVKNLEGVETLGSTSCICSDKTGTLTQNMMYLYLIIVHTRPILVPVLTNPILGTFDKLLRCATFIADTSRPKPFMTIVDIDGRKQKQYNWKPLAKFAQMMNSKDADALSNYMTKCNEEYPRIAQIPFNSKNKYQVGIHWDDEKKSSLLVMKGAPERIWNRCDKIWKDNAEKEKIIALQEQCAEDGLRVLGFCELELPRKYDSFTPLNFLGLFAMIDPARPQVPGAVKLCKTAGIRVIMVTGDHPTTAQAIAQDVGIIDGPATTSDYEKFNKRHGLTKEPIPWFNPVLAPAMVVPGWELIGKEDCDKFKDVWDDILGHTQIVFARTSPQQKLIIVENCQRRDEIVAVTGDGVNDAPALKKADIGVAMGIMGSDVSKEAADMILLDDNFASIVADLGTDMVPAISMAWEDPESDIMKRPPRNAEIDALVTKKLVVFSYLQIGVIQAIAGFYTWFVVMQDYGYPPHIVPELGAFDNWGKRTMFLAGKPYANESEYLSKGKVQFRNLTEAKTNVTYTMPSTELIRNYPFWDGPVDQCTFPIRNFSSNDIEEASKLATTNCDNCTEYSSTCNYSFTDGEDVATNRSFEALEYNGYRPYVHVDGRNSPFFKKEWFAYDVGSSDQEVPGLSKDVATLIAFSVEPPAYFHVNTMKMDGTTPYTKLNSASCDTGDAEMKKTKNVMDTDDSTTGTAKEMQVEAWYNLIDVQAKYYPGKGTDAADYKIDASVDDQPEFWNINFDGYEVSNNEIIIKNVTVPTKLKDIIDAVCDGVCVNVVSRMVQKEALHHAQCAYFISIIVVQWADLVICKTRMNSMYHQALGTRPIKLVHWFPGCPYSVFIFCYDETRKYIMRKGTKVKTDPISGQVTRDPCWMERNTYY